MNFFNRLTDIVTSNINSILDGSEDPRAAINQIVSEMEQGVGAAHRSATSARTKAAQLRCEVGLYQRKIDFWNAKARESVACDRDDLARRALVRRRELEDVAGALRDELRTADDHAEHLKTTLRALEARLIEARRRQNQPATEDVSREPRDAASQADQEDDSSRIDRLEREIAQAEAELFSVSEEADALCSPFDATGEDLADVEADLAALKREQPGRPST
ncbi:MAG: PspA/IM30 family protein [Planctomycetales bacterium]